MYSLAIEVLGKRLPHHANGDQGDACPEDKGDRSAKAKYCRDCSGQDQGGVRVHGLRGGLEFGLEALDLGGAALGQRDQRLSQLEAGVIVYSAFKFADRCLPAIAGVGDLNLIESALADARDG